MSDNPLLNHDNASQEAERARQLADVVASSRIGVKEGRKIEMKAGFSEEKKPEPQTEKPEATPEIPHEQSHNMRDDIQLALKNAVLQEAPTVSDEKPHLNPERSMTQAIKTELESAQMKRPLTVTMPVNQVRPDTLENKAAVLHTLKQDVEGLVQNRKVSMVRAAALESDKTITAADLDKDPVVAQQNTWLLVSAAIIGTLALVTAGAAYYAYTMTSALSQDKITQARYDTALVFFEHVQPFDITDLESYELRGGLAQLRDSIPATLGSVTLFDFMHKMYDPTSGTYVTEPVDLPTFLRALKPHIPETLLSSLSGEYFVGVHAIEENAPFIMLKITEPDRAFAGMLSWEKQIGQDLQPFFESRGVPVGGEILQFSDISVDSIDARVVRGADGNIRIIYAITEKNILVITNNIQTLREVTDRAHTQTLKKKGVTAQ